MELHDNCIMLSRIYMRLYLHTHRLQTKLRIPTIFLSSFSGAASFVSSSFPATTQKYVSIAVGVINVGIAMIQTYESYLKIGDIVSKSLAVSTSFKKLAEDIYCEIFLPVNDRISNGITFLRDCFTRYQTIMEQCPPIDDSMFSANAREESVSLFQRISRELKIQHKDSHPPMANHPTPSNLFGRTLFNNNINHNHRVVTPVPHKKDVLIPVESEYIHRDDLIESDDGKKPSSSKNS